MVKKKNIMKIPQQPWQQNAFKYGITFLIVVSSKTTVKKLSFFFKISQFFEIPVSIFLIVVFFILEW